MNYWHMQLHPADNNWRAKDILEGTYLIGLGAGVGNSAIEQFRDEMKTDDIVAVADGKTSAALVKVIGECEDAGEDKWDDDRDDWFRYRRKVEVLESSDKYKIAGSISALQKSVDHNAETYKTIDKWYKRINKEKEKYMKDIKNLLTNNKQLVLTGAPGTGKTYLARELAAELIGVKDKDTELSKNEQYAFVQFHPSYDYTDFVEGFRPVRQKDDHASTSSIGFELRDGIFKKFCKKAKEDPKKKIRLHHRRDQPRQPVTGLRRALLLPGARLSG